MKRGKRKVKPAYAWAWAVDFGKGLELCSWSEPTRYELIDGNKPSPKAKATRVKMQVLK